MKTTITILGLAAFLFTTTTKAANEFKTQDLNQQDIATTVVNEQQDNQLIAVNQDFSTIALVNNSEDIVVPDFNSGVKADYQNTVAEIIAENKLITDCEDENVQPLFEMTIEDGINENNQIIESNVSSEVYPLDFEKINRAVKSTKVVNNNMAVTVDLKL